MPALLALVAGKGVLFLRAYAEALKLLQDALFDLAIGGGGHGVRCFVAEKFAQQYFRPGTGKALGVQVPGSWWLGRVDRKKA